MKNNPGGKNSPPGFSFCGLLFDDLKSRVFRKVENLKINSAEYILELDEYTTSFFKINSNIYKGFWIIQTGSVTYPTVYSIISESYIHISSYNQGDSYTSIKLVSSKQPFETYYPILLYLL